ncbi:MAG: hypothetical protein Q8R92_08905 [Deltaproteobacteria bacterium]|nr:hypothetical protein [Deltaproteobacteria bacterium]
MASTFICANWHQILTERELINSDDLRCSECGAREYWTWRTDVSRHSSRWREENRRSGFTTVATLPPGTRIFSYGGRMIVAGPDQPPAIVTESGLDPLTSERALELSLWQSAMDAEKRAALKAKYEGRDG